MLWLWHKPVAAALIQPLAWELLYAASVALQRKKKKDKRGYKKTIEEKSRKSDMQIRVPERTAEVEGMG